MNWLSDNWKLLFDGIGGTAAVALIGYLWKWWSQSRQRPSGQEATLTAPEATVSDSPIASGTGITQNVNSPTIHLNLPPPLAAVNPAPRPEPARVEREVPRSRIIVTATRVIGITQTGPTKWSENRQYADRQGIVIQFTNEAGRGYRNDEHIVRASLVYRDEQNELERITGGWIDQDTDLARFKVEESHRLLVGVLINEDFVALEQRRVLVGSRSEVCNTTPHLLRDFQQGTVRVRLMDIHAQSLLYEGTFEIGRNPLRISPASPV